MKLRACLILCVLALSVARSGIGQQQTSPTLTWEPSPSEITYNTPLSGAQLNATADTPGSFVYTPSLGTILPAGAHTLSATFTPDDPIHFKTAIVTAIITVTPVDPPVTWNPDPSTITYGTPLSAAQLDATSTVAGSYYYSPHLGNVLPAGIQRIAVRFIPTDSNYNFVYILRNITVNQAIPTIAWNPDPAMLATGARLTSAQLDATVTGVQGQALDGVLTYTPRLGSLLTPGQHVISVLFTPTDSLNYQAVRAFTTITVSGSNAVVTWMPSPATLTYGTALSGAQLDATASVPGSFSYSPQSGSVLSAGEQVLSAVFTPTDPSQTPVTATAAIHVAQATPAVTWRPNPANITFGSPLTGGQLNARSATPGSFFYTPAIGTVLPPGVQALSVLFIPSDSLNFKAVTQTATIVVADLPSPITWNPDPAITTFGTPLSAGQLNATSPTPGTLTYTPALGKILQAGTQVLAVTFTPTDKNAPATNVIRTITVLRAAPALSWSTPAPISSGTPLSAAQLNATAAGVTGAPLSGFFKYTPGIGAVLPGGVSTLKLLFSPSDDVDYNPATTSVQETITAAATLTTLTGTTTQSQFGQPVSFAASVRSGATPVSGAVSFYDGAVLLGSSTGRPATLTTFALTLGAHNITAVFSATASYSGSTSAILTVQVTAASTTIAWTPNPANLSYGSPLTANQLDATVSTAYTRNVAGTFTYTPALGTVLPVGTQVLKVTFTPVDTAGFLSSTSTASVNIGIGAPVVNWTPIPSTISYGVPLSAAQLDATSSIAGGFTYTPPSGTVLSVGTHTISVLFSPSDSSNYKPVNATAVITVTTAVPVIAWHAPDVLAAGTPLSATQLDATATGIDGVNLPGTFVYTPAAGTILPMGMQKISAFFTPADSADYSTATDSVTIDVVSVSLSAVSPSTALLGDSDKTIALTGAGFLPSAVVQMNGAPVPTSFVSSTSLMAVVPASSFIKVGAVQVTVSETALGLVSNAVPLLVTAPPTTVQVSGPQTVLPDTQPTFDFKVDPYPVDLDATFTLSFVPSAGLSDDPTVIFSSGTQVLDVQVQRGTTDIPVQFQSGTVAGTITLTASFEAGGAVITPSTIHPLVVQAPPAVPGVTSVSLTQNGHMLTVVTRGYSNTREISGAKFHFTPVSDKKLETTDLTVDVSSLFTKWYADPDSIPYGSQFTYSQSFDLSTDADAVGGASVTLTNQVGASPEAATP